MGKRLPRNLSEYELRSKREGCPRPLPINGRLTVAGIGPNPYGIPLWAATMLATDSEAFPRRP